MDVSRSSLMAVSLLRLPNVKTVESLIENFQPEQTYQWIVLSEIIEHLRKPGESIARCLTWLAPEGSLLITTPNGHWESDEHLHEFSLNSLSQLLINAGAEALTISYLRDVQQRRRWLTARIVAPLIPAAPDNFHSHVATLLARRQVL